MLDILTPFSQTHANSYLLECYTGGLQTWLVSSAELEIIIIQKLHIISFFTTSCPSNTISQVLRSDFAVNNGIVTLYGNSISFLFMKEKTRRVSNLPEIRLYN